MKFRYISTDRNPKRVWPLASKGGVVVKVPTSHWIETEHDLSEWVESGLIKGGPVGEAELSMPAQLIAPVTVPVPTSQSKNPYESMAKAMEDVFNKSVPAPPAVPPVVVLVEEPLAAVEVVSDAETLASYADAVVPASEDTDFALLTREVLWNLALQRGLTANLAYRSTTKAELIRLLNGEA